MKDGKFKNKRNFQFDIIEKWIKSDKKINISKIAKELGVSRQQVYRLLKKYHGNQFFIDHSNTNRIKKDQLKIKEVQELYLNYCNQIKRQRNDDHFVPNFKIFNDFLLKDKYHLSQRTVYNYLIDGLIYSPDSRYKTKKEIRKKIKVLNKTSQILDVIDNDKNEIKKIKPYKSKNTGIFGDIVEIDACQHQWFNNEKYHIYTAVDRKSGYLLATHIEKEETTKGYYILLSKLFKIHGKPRKIITDKRRNFWSGIDHETLMKQTLKELDIELFSSSQATAKPNVERAYRNMQDIYPMMFYQQNINTLEQAIKVIDQYQDKYNEYYKKHYEYENNFLIIGDDEIKNSMTLKKKIRVRNGSYLTMNGQSLAPFGENNKRWLLKEGSYVIINITLNNDEIFVIHQGRKLILKPVSDDDIFEYFNDKNLELILKRREIEKQKIINRKIQAHLARKEEQLLRKEKYLHQKEIDLGII